MTTYALIILVAVFFATSVVGVVTGSNSLIAVPVMFQFGIEPRVAVATNMLGTHATEERITELHQQMGLDRPIWEQYLLFMAIRNGSFGPAKCLM